jgi:spectinomycin phosphotransferase
MLTPPSDLDETALIKALAGWGLRDARLEYLPVGFGSHHWRAEREDGTRAFVTVDDLAAGFQAGDDVDTAFDGLVRAYGTAAALRDTAGLEFVLAALPDDESVLLRRVGARYAVSVVPFVDGTSSFGAYETKEERRRAAELVGRVHTAGEVVGSDLPLRDDYTIYARFELGEALTLLDRPWTTGPFGEPARALLAARADDLERRLREYDVSAERVRERSGSWVVTHGEPHRGNLLVGADGRLHLVDWDTTRVAPRERDLWLVLDDDLTGWDEYTAIVGDVELDREGLALAEERWALSDIALFVDVLRRPHADDDQTGKTFRSLRSYLAL